MARNINHEEAAKPLAKSLHTISVLVNLGLHLNDGNEHDGPKVAATRAVRAALKILGHAGKEDPYGLAATAIDQLAARIKAANKGDE